MTHRFDCVDIYVIAFLAGIITRCDSQRAPAGFSRTGVVITGLYIWNNRLFVSVLARVIKRAETLAFNIIELFSVRVSTTTKGFVVLYLWKRTKSKLLFLLQKDETVPIMERITINKQMAQFRVKLSVVISLSDIKAIIALGKAKVATDLNRAFHCQYRANGNTSLCAVPVHSI